LNPPNPTFHYDNTIHPSPQHNHPIPTKPASAKDRSIVLFKDPTLYFPIPALGRSLYHPPQPPIALKPTKTSFLSRYRTHKKSYYACFLRTLPNSIPSPPCTKHTRTQLYLLSPRISSLGGVNKKGEGDVKKWWWRHVWRSVRYLLRCA
jgi:hypothetical protein